MSERRRITPKALLVAVGLACYACHDSGPTETIPLLALPLTNRIVFESKRADTLGDVFAMNLDGTDVRRLTDASTKDACPSLSPDGNWIAFYRKAVSDTALRYDLRPDSLAVMKANGTEIKMLAAVWYSPTQCPLWSPDSRAFALEEITGNLSKTTPSYQVRTFALDGRLVAQFSVSGFVGLSFSPDGLRFVGQGFAVSANGGPYGETVITVNIDGSVGRNLGAGNAPRWSPVRNEVVYLCSGVCLVADDGSAPRMIVADQTNGVFLGRPAFTSDGSAVALTCGSDLCVVDLQSGGVTRTNLGVQSADYAWTADNQWVVFTCSVAPFYVGDICSIRRDGTGFSNLTNDPASDSSPSLSPGGT